MGECVTSTGRPKRRWATRADAKAALRMHQATGIPNNGQRPYRCQVCGFFHLGRYPATSTGLKQRRREHLDRRRLD